MGYTNAFGWVVIFFVRKKIFGFSYLSLNLSLTLLHKEKVLWSSYFRFFIKSMNFSGSGNFFKKINCFSTPWKITIPLGNTAGYPI